MAAPPAKKIKTENSETVDLTTTKDPIVFTTPGIAADVCFHVFEQDFHVYSEFLKVSSNFFKTFFEQAGDNRPASSSPKFPNGEWYTKVTEDGHAWSLSPDPKFRETSILRYTNPNSTPSLQEAAFKKVLCAIFNRRYEIEDCKELDAITSHARDCCLLPILSNSILVPLYSSPKLIFSIREKPLLALECAYQLRNKQLFNDSLIHLLAHGPWTGGQPRQTKQLKEEKVRRIAGLVYSRMRDKLLSIQEGMLAISANFQETGRAMADLAKCAQDKQKNILMPRYFRLCHNYKYKSVESAQLVKQLLAPILENHLVLDKSGVSGQGDFRGCFLSFDVETYPWDDTEQHW